MNKRLIIIIVSVSAALVVILWGLSLMRGGVTAPTVDKPVTLPLSDSRGFLGNRNNLPAIIGEVDKQTASKSTVLQKARQLAKDPVSGSMLITKQIDVIQDRIKTKELVHNIR